MLKPGHTTPTLVIFCNKIYQIAMLLFATLLLLSATVRAQDVSEHRVVVDAPPDFRDISLHTWKGIPRLGLPDSKGLVGPVYGGHELQKALRENPTLANQLGESLERHNYSLGLLAILDYMRSYPDCFANMNKYEAKTESCADTLIQHSAQLESWRTYVTNIALSLSPAAHGKLFCQHADGEPVCGATAIDQVSVKDANGRAVRLDEFQRRDFFSTLMREHEADFEKLWRSSSLPGEAWYVELVQLSEYDFDKQRYAFTVAPIGSLVSNMFQVPQKRVQMMGKKKVGSVLQSRMFALSPKYTAVSDFEKSGKFTAGRPIQISLPMNASDARELGQSNKNRRFFAVTKVRFLPRENPTAWKSNAGANTLAYHYAENKVALYRDSSLSQKVAELPLTEVAAVSAADSSPAVKWQWADGHRIFDNRAYVLLRLKKAGLPDDQLQRLTNSVASGERQTWMAHEQRREVRDRLVETMKNQPPNPTTTDRLRLAEDRTKLSHLNWQQMDSGQRNTLYEYMLGTSDTPNAWPSSFPSVSWGINAATIFKKGHFSTDRTLAHIPATDGDKAVVQKFLTEIARTYPTDKLTLVYGLRDTRYDNDSKTLKFSSWPFNIRPAVTFDDNVQEITRTGGQIVSADAKARAIYPFSISNSSLGTHVPDPPVGRCRRNEKRQSEDCVTGYGHFLQFSWGESSFALDRELAMPELSMDPVRAANLLSSRKYQGPDWRLVVELEDVDMTLSPYEYKPNGSKPLQKGEAQTIFASVKSAYILAPDDEIVWQVSSGKLAKPVDGSKLTQVQPADFKWVSPVQLYDATQVDRAIYDFLFVKYYPGQVDQRFLEAMFSSRWSYEQSAASPTGGRFFNPDARPPSWQDVQKSIPAFKQWMTRRAASMPDDFAVTVPVRYAYDTVSTMSNCVKLKLTPDSPLRNSSGAKALAAQKVRQCKTAENQAKSKFERCASLRKELGNSNTALEKAQQAGCTQTVANEPEDTIEIGATGSCDFSNIDFSNMQVAVQACMADRCGPTPTTMDGMVPFQKCVQAVSTEMQEQLRAAMGGGRPKPSKQSATTVLDNCKPHQLAIRDTERSLKSNRCETHLVEPAAMNCDALGEIPKASHMHVGRLIFGACSVDAAYMRKTNSSASLLPNYRPYSDTELALEVGVGELRVPYDPPYSSTTPSDAIIDIGFQIRSVEASNRNTTMKLQAEVSDSVIRPAN